MSTDPSTLAVRAGRRPDPATGAVVEPICQSTTYAQASLGAHQGHTYSRASNPTVSTLEEALGALEGAGLPGVCFSTGMAAIAALVTALARTGDHVLVSDVVYGGTVRLLREVFESLGVAATYADAGDPEAFASHITPHTRLVLIETPGNPTLRLADIGAISAHARRRGVPLAVDATFLTPIFQKPLDLGADIVVHSTTKYIEGHGTTLGGAVLSRDARWLDRLRLVRKTLGSIQSPFEAWLTLRGLSTLPLRMARHAASAFEIARRLEAHPSVARVIYPWLESFAQHDLARRQQGSGGGIVSFELAGDSPEDSYAAGRRLLARLRLCTLAENLGSVQTLITHPASMTHADVPASQRERAGITPGLIRLSVGLESVDDLIADLWNALDIEGGSDDDRAEVRQFCAAH